MSHRILGSFPVRIAAAALVASIVGPAPTASAGESDDGPRFSRLELLPATPGGTSGVDLRTCSPQAPFLLLLDGSAGSIDPDGGGPLPFLRVLGGSTLILSGATDAAGRFRALAAVPNEAALQGATFFAQALTVLPGGGFEATNVAATTVAPGAPSFSYVDRSANVPTAGATNSSFVGAARDLDRDGDPDLVVITGPAGSVHVFRNDGGFAFTDVTATALPLAAQIEAAYVELFDADGDGHVDMFIVGGAGAANGEPLPNLLLRNVGGGAGISFQTAALPAVPGIARDVAVFDADCDGDLDLVLANGSDGVHSNEQAVPNTLLVNQGRSQGGVEGTFAIDAAFQAAAWNGPDFNIAVCAGDVDGDGDVDLFFGRSDTQLIDGTPGQPNVLLLNQGGLVFADVSATHLQPLFSDNTQGARFGDLDGDGALDLIVANSTVSVVSAISGDYYRNQGNGVFVEDNASFPQIDESEVALRVGVRLDDVDLDGDLDALFLLHEFIDFDGSSGSQTGTGGDDQLFVNQGGAQGGTHGVFALDPTFSATGIFITADHVIADFDLDGDDDVYICNTGGFFTPTFPIDDRLLENTRIP
ncbi:MAG: FG-GAP repeat domain-containing protein [Planctomycetota bacterium JB042]